MNFKLNDLGMKERLIILSIIFAFLFGGISIYYFRGIKELGDMNKKLYEDLIKGTRVTLNLRKSIKNTENYLKEMLLAENDFEFQSAVNDINFEKREMYKELELIRTISLEETGYELLKDIEDMIYEEETIIDDIVRLYTEDKEGLFKTNIKFVAKKHIEKLNRKIESMILYTEERSDEFYQEYNRSRKELLNRVSWIMTLAIILIIIINIIFFRGMTNLVTNLTAQLLGINSFKNLKKLKIEGENEISRIADGINGLIVKLEELFWVQNGINTLFGNLSKNKELDKTCNDVIKEMTNYVNGAKGLVYIYDEEESILKLIGSYAFVERDSLANKYKIGESLIGEVAQERKPILLKGENNIEDKIDTGVYKDKPQNIFAVPIIYFEKLYGVSLISTNKKLREVDREFILKSTEKLSYFIANILNAKETRKLLEKAREAEKRANLAQEKLEDKNKVLQEKQRELENQKEELKNQNAELEAQQNKIEEKSNEIRNKNLKLKEKQRNLIEKSKELKKANEYKNDFLANMSHELRTPLNSIILLSEILGKRMKSIDSGDQEKIDVINNAGHELLRLVNDLLDLSKIESGKLKLDIIQFNSGELTKSIEDMFKDEAIEEELEFKIEDRYNGILRSDKDKILQILRNLISNAIKFTKEGYVKLEIEEYDSENLLMLVKDTGIGIPDNLKSEIFKKFTQIDSSISKEHKGTGLGLSISKKLVEILNGSLLLESEEGKGTTFKMIIPKRNDSTGEVSSSLKNVDEKLKRSKSIILTDDSIGDKEYKIEFDKEILVIDDDSNFTKGLEEIFKNYNLNYRIGYNGRSGLEKLDENIGMIFLDLMLPDISGMEVLRKIRGKKDYKQLPIYILSAKKKNENYLDYGKTKYIAKPISEKKILELIKGAKFLDEKEGKILVNLENVEDKNFISDTIRDLNIKAEEVSDFKEIKSKIKTSNYLTLITDLKLGAEKIGELKKTIPVILYTDKNIDEKMEFQLRKNVDTIITKSKTAGERLVDEIYRLKNPRAIKKEVEDIKELDFTNTKILVVDDDIKNLFVVSSIFENTGAKIIEAQNGQEALDILKEQDDIDLILMDIMMPKMSGYEAIEKIREDDEIADIPIIALTAKALERDRKKTLEIGADDYIAKPVSAANVMGLSKAWISKKRDK